jgi:hypothetical protein
MSRSRGQIASAYTPGRHFTFENGLGACIAVPKAGPRLDLPRPTREQLLMRLKEATETWYQQGLRFVEAQGDAGHARALRPLLVDPDLFSLQREEFEFVPDRFGFLAPAEMGYEVSPTTLVCGNANCGLLKPCRHYGGMLDFLEATEGKCMHPRNPGKGGKGCDWRQFEPIFVHPSGSWKSISMEITDFDSNAGSIYKRLIVCESCGARDFCVDTQKIALGDWYLKCAKCGVRYNSAWIDHDAEYARLRGLGLVDIIEMRMEKISYGASAAYHVQAETFVDFPEGERLECLDLGGDVLKAEIAVAHGYVEALPSAAAAIEELRKRGTEAQVWATQIEMNLRLLGQFERIADEGGMEEARGAIAQALRTCLDRKLLSVKAELPRRLGAKVDQRSELWASRYDPFRLTIEHAVLAETKLSERIEGSRRSFVPFRNPDEWLRHWRDDEDKTSILSETEGLLSRLGLSQAGLVPKFHLCRFTYGYSRTSPFPVPQRAGRSVPTRLCLFDHVTVGGEFSHPVYVLRQQNEAFYFRLNPNLARRWLEGLGCVDAGLLQTEPSLGGALLSSAHPMGRFLDEHDGTASGRDATPPRLYAAAYGLLHTYAHHVMRAIARLSGLDEGALGEYIFPADLGFIVYRSGMTMDLGDLSSLWRNNWRPFLSDLLGYPTSLGCNLGSLCAEQGGACPDCLMIPEVTCVAGNKYLSRSLLTGEGVPSYMDFKGGGIEGFLALSSMDGWAA